MKIETLNSIFTTTTVRSVVALLFFVCLSLGALESGKAQLKNQRRVTGVLLGTSPEGSRVTVASDTPLNDYEGFRRGDRFYLKIPWADFVSAMPRFKGDGFDDVQVQKVGDSLIVSFKLQPGATARIDQRGNRLDVLFSVAKQSFNNSTVAGVNRNSPGNLSPYTSNGSGNSDNAGPLPPGSVASRDRFVESFDQSGFPRNARLPRNAKSRANRDASNSISNQALTAASPLPSPSATFSPLTSSSYPPVTAVTPSNSNSTVAGSRSTSSNWSNSKAAITRWVSSNRLATLVTALIVLSLLIYLISGLRRRETAVAQGREAKSTKVQPKYSPNESLDELSSDKAERLAQHEAVATQPSTHTMAKSEQRATWTLPNPAVVSAGGGSEKLTDKEDREVFEL
jgi:hypothetical protein